jgi:hypothetical protein
MYKSLEVGTKEYILLMVLVSGLRIHTSLEVFTPDHNSILAALNLPEHSLATAFLQQFTSTSFAFLYIPEQEYSANDCRKDFMINHSESDLHLLEISQCPIY